MSCAAPPCSRRVKRFTCMVRIKPALSALKSAMLARANAARLHPHSPPADDMQGDPLSPSAARSSRRNAFSCTLPPPRIHKRVVARFATGKLRASLSQCAACRQLRGGVFPSQRRHLAAHFRPPGPDMYYRSRGGKCNGGFTTKNMQTK